MDHLTISAIKHKTTLLTGIQSTGINPNLQQMILAAGGSAHPSFVGIGQISPEITFACHAIKTCLAGLGGKDGIAIDTNLDLWFQKLTAGGLRAGDESHTKVTAANGMIIPVSISASQGQPAVINYRVVIVSADGSTSPLAFTASQSLESGQDVNSEVYTLGAVTLNDTQLEGVDSWSLNFGNDVWINHANGLVYPTEVGIMNQAPSFSVSTADAGKFATWELVGLAQNDTDSTVVLQDQAAGGVRGSSPITFSIDDGMAVFDNLSGAQGSRYAGSVTITPVYDGTAAIIAITGLT